MEKQLAESVRELAGQVGYDSCGITHAGDFAEFAGHIEERKRRFPEAAGLYQKLLARAYPCRQTPWAKSIVVCVRRYGKYDMPGGLAGRIGRTYLFDRRNPESPEHDMPKKMRLGLARMGLRVRRGGTPDRWAGARAGVTRFGRNSFGYSRHGSWINIETWLVDAKLPPDEPTLAPACPENCRACVDSCPTGALVEPFVMRIDRCVAYLTYASPEPVEPELWNKMGEWIYGCDKCQEVCPLNKGAWENLEKAPWLEKIAHLLKPEALASMRDDTYRNAVHPAFWYIPLDNVERWRANAARAASCSRMGCPQQKGNTREAD